MQKKTVYGLLALILAIGAFLRIYDLGFESLWLDESVTAAASQKSSFEIINNIYSKSALFPEFFATGSGEMPLYYVISSILSGIFGISEFGLRIFPALCGIASIFLIFVIGKMLFNEKIGLISSFILSINHQHIFYSQEARAYSFLTFFTLLSIYFLLNALNQNKTSFWVSYSICAAALIYTHYLSFFILMFQWSYILLYWKSYKHSLKKFIISAFAVFLSYLPWIPVLLNQLTNKGFNYYYTYKPTLYNLAYILTHMNSWISPDFSTRIALRSMDFRLITLNGWLALASIIAITLVLGVFFILGVFWKKNFSAHSQRKNNVFLIFWLAIPILIPFILSIIFPSASITGTIRYILFATPAYYLLAAKGILRFHKSLKIFLIVFTLLSLAPLYNYYANFDKEQWEDASNYLRKNVNKNEIILINHKSSVFALKYYYKEENIVGVENVEEAKPIIMDKNSLWLIYSSEKFSDSQHKIKNYLDKTYKLESQIELTGIKIYHYSRTI